MSPGRRKISFLERLTGAVPVEDDFQEKEEVMPPRKTVSLSVRGSGGSFHAPETNDEPEDAQLTIDMYQTPDAIIVKAMVAGVRPDELEVNITRDTLTVRGVREEDRSIVDDDYYFQELYWGGFARTVLLPEEVDPDAAEATQRHGLLTIRMPKIDKKRKQQLRVKAG